MAEFETFFGGSEPVDNQQLQELVRQIATEKRLVVSGSWRAFGIRLARQVESMPAPKELRRKLLSGTQERLLRPDAYQYLRAASLRSLSITPHIQALSQDEKSTLLTTPRFGSLGVKLTKGESLLELQWQQAVGTPQTFHLHGTKGEKIVYSESNLHTVEIGNYVNALEITERLHTWYDPSDPNKETVKKDPEKAGSVALNGYKAVLLAYSIDEALEKGPDQPDG